MLNNKPPPGYNTEAVNSQQVNYNNTPGIQGATAQGYFTNPYRSSYATPSSYAVPSTVPSQNTFYAGKPQPQGQANAQMIRALMGNQQL